MALKRRTKASAEFSMASLTDVIFLLLIFFVLTSKLVNINPFDLPESDSKTVAPVTVVVEIGEDLQLKYDGVPMSVTALETAIGTKLREIQDKKDFTITIAAYKDVPFESVVDVIEVAGRLKVKAILATQPRQS
jgi:biopolymer transport protein ExbD